jgi:hypothetical protein
MWLTFDDIETPRGWRPLLAQLIDAPGVHSIHVLYDREGEIQAASVNRDEAMKAAMAGAFAGAATGMATGKEKDAAVAAATAAATAFDQQDIFVRLLRYVCVRLDLRETAGTLD